MFKVNNEIAGEYRYQILRADGTVKEESDFKKNLVVDGGLDIIGKVGFDSSHINHENYWQRQCAVGTGNSTPLPSQTSLDVLVKKVDRVPTYGSVKKDYVNDESGIYTCSFEAKYDFVGLGEINITEIGLMNDTVLCTRALIKDKYGDASSISILTGEILVVYYKVTAYYSTLPVSSVVNIEDGKGGTVPYNVVIGLLGAGTGSYGNIPARGIGSSQTRDVVKFPVGSVVLNDTGLVGDALFPVNYTIEQVRSAAGAARLIKYTSSTESTSSHRLFIQPYVIGSFVRVILLNATINDFNGSIRYIGVLGTSSIGFQVRFGSVADDSPIVKTDRETLKIPFEVRWSRRVEV